VACPFDWACVHECAVCWWCVCGGASAHVKQREGTCSPPSITALLSVPLRVPSTSALNNVVYRPAASPSSRFWLHAALALRMRQPIRRVSGPSLAHARCGSLFWAPPSTKHHIFTPADCGSDDVHKQERSAVVRTESHSREHPWATPSFNAALLVIGSLCVSLHAGVLSEDATSHVGEAWQGACCHCSGRGGVPAGGNQGPCPAACAVPCLAATASGRAIIAQAHPAEGAVGCFCAIQGAGARAPGASRHRPPSETPRGFAVGGGAAAVEMCGSGVCLRAPSGSPHDNMRTRPPRVSHSDPRLPTCRTTPRLLPRAH